MAETAVQKRRRSKFEFEVLFFIVRDILVRNASATAEEIETTIRSKFDNYEPTQSMISEARYIYKQKVKRGELPAPGGFMTLEAMLEFFGRLSKFDRIKFVDIAQKQLRAS